jgi:aerobic carbon-monoxide dehydrogenase small subunit
VTAVRTHEGGRGAAYRFTLNGEPCEVAVPGMRRLLDVLREDLGLTGTKEGCGEGECGACSVIIDGLVVDSCLVPVCQVAGSDIRTVEGLTDAETGALSPLQAAFLEHGGAQCGICTPGMLMAAQAYLDDGGSADEDAIREAIAGNLCRCTGYTKIIDAIEAAAVAGAADAADPGRGDDLSHDPSRGDDLSHGAGGPGGG